MLKLYINKYQHREIQCLSVFLWCVVFFSHDSDSRGSRVVIARQRHRGTMETFEGLLHGSQNWHCRKMTEQRMTRRSNFKGPRLRKDRGSNTTESNMNAQNKISKAFGVGFQSFPKLALPKKVSALTHKHPMKRTSGKKCAVQMFLPKSSFARMLTTNKARLGKTVHVYALQATRKTHVRPYTSLTCLSKSELTINWRARPIDPLMHTTQVTQLR